MIFRMAVDNGNVVSDVATLTALTPSAGDSKFIQSTDEFVTYFPLATSGDYEPDTPGGFWIEKTPTIVTLVATDYDFGGNGDTDITNIIVLDNYLETGLISLVDCRASIEYYYQNDLSSNWSSLSSEEKVIIAKFFLTGYTNRSTIYTDAEQGALAKNLLFDIHQDGSDINLSNEATIIHDADLSKVDNLLDEATLPLVVSVNGVTGSTVSLISSDIPYTAATPSNWQVNPTDVKQGLDESGQRISVIEDTDRQSIYGTTSLTTTSTNFTDMAGMGLTTSNTYGKRYMALFSGTFDGAINPNEIRVGVNGVGITSSTFRFVTKGTSTDEVMGFSQFLTNELPNDTYINIQWRKVNGTGNLNVYERSLIIYSL